MAEFRFAGNGKRDIHGVEAQFDASYEELRQEKWHSEANKEIVLAYLKACLLGEAKSAGRNRKVGKAWLYRLLGQLRRLSEEWLRKDFDKTSPIEWKQLYEDLELDRITQASGKRFSPTTKAKIYKLLRKFLKWRYGENKRYPEYCDSWVTSEPTVTKPYLTRHEVEQLVTGTTTSRVRCMVMMLFDGGFRVEELGNLRWADVQQRDGKDYYQAHVRAETSKTKRERYVSLYLCTDQIDAYRHSEEARLGTTSPEEYLFPRNYQGLYKTVKRLGKRILNKDISPHALRHSSATYYANIIKTYQQFCTRYGWRLNSAVAQRYYHAVHDDEVAAQAKEHEIARFKTEFERVRLQNTTLTNELDKMRRELQALNEFKEAFFQQLIETGEADAILKKYRVLTSKAAGMHYKH